MKHRINIKGAMIPTSYKWYYDWFGMESTCPQDVQKVISQAHQGDEIEVYINSPGGVIDVGSEIYTMLRQITETCSVKIFITGEACSAASIVACAAYSIMSPTALMMVHCVSTSDVSGNHTVMEHTAKMLVTADNALCTAYMTKAGMSREDALNMMEQETWLTAEQAKERGLVDEVMFEEKAGGGGELVAGPFFRLPSEERLAQIKASIEGDKGNAGNSVEAKLRSLELTGLKNKKRKE
ncbi:MAG: Clp protease ClpP [Lachnospiraceae bacterium]|nr:Clp protease ClpP [Lachnospiraceae bacterium]